jgi:ribosomal protein L28
MNSHQRRKKRRQWNRNKITAADWKEFGRQLQRITMSTEFLASLEILASLLTSFKRPV